MTFTKVILNIYCHIFVKVDTMFIHTIYELKFILYVIFEILCLLLISVSK